MHRLQSGRPDVPSGVRQAQWRSVQGKYQIARYDAYEDEDGNMGFGSLRGEELSLVDRLSFLPPGYASERYTNACRAGVMRSGEIPMGMIAVKTTVDQHETVADRQIDV